MSADLLYIPSSTVPNTFLKTNSVLSSTLQKVNDNAGNASVLSLGTTNIGIASHVLYDWIAAPTGEATKTAFFFDATGRMAWRNGTGFLRTFDATGITADRVYSLPNATTTLAGLSVANTFTERQLITPPSLTGSSATSALSIAQTWNTTGNPSAIFLNVTNTASGATATLMDLQVGGVSQLSISKAGAIVTAAGITSTATIQQSSTSDFRWNNRSRIFSDANANIRLTNSANADFGLLQFGGTTSSFPAIKKSSTTLQARLADDSGFASFQGKLTTEGAATTGLVAGVLAASTNASITLYDSTGQAYRVPVII